MTTTPFSYSLRPHQQQAYEWLTAHPKAILADDTGLGKTRSAARLIADHLPALVVVPGYLTQQWFDILCDVMPHASISMPEGQRGRREWELQKPADVTVVNLEMLRTYEMPKVETLVIDEAHHIRNPRSIQSANARRLCWRTNRVVLLTGTPYYKADEDIWHLLHCISPHRFSSYWNFLREWFTVNWNAAYTPKIYGITKKKRPKYEEMVSDFMLLRTYEDVGRTLPPLIEEVITFNLPEALRREYLELKKRWQLLGEPIESVGSVYYILRQFTMCSEKIQAVNGIIDSINRKEPVLVYTWYKESAHTLAGKLRHEHDNLLLTGDTPPNTRAELLAQQKRTGHPRVIIATIEALQEGVNLEHIRHVVYAEETYVKGKHIQTLARARRDRGDKPQTDAPVIAYYVRARKTIDEQIPHIRNSRGNAGDHELARRLAAS